MGIEKEATMTWNKNFKKFLKGAVLANKIFCDYGNVLCLCAISHVWLLSTWNVANLTEGLNLKLEVNYG